LNQSLDEICINTIRFLSVDSVEKADSGHPGLPLGAAPMAYVLWTKFLKHNPADPHWPDRDRFILSAGHGSMLLYSLLFLTGYDLNLGDLEQFRQWSSRTPGHPEYGVTPGVECTTGPLGQGFGNAVGMAIAEAHLAACYNQPGFDIVNHYTYVLVSDGDMMEGVTSEAASLAGHLRLGKLICLYDSNHISLSASTMLDFTEDVSARFTAYGWHTQTINDGNDLSSIKSSISTARAETSRPSLIIINTHLGYGSPMQDTYEVHGSPLGEKNIHLTKNKLGWPEKPPFYVPSQAIELFRKALDVGHQSQLRWDSLMSDYRKLFPDQAKEFQKVLKNEIHSGWDNTLPVFPPDVHGVKTRVACGKALNASVVALPQLMGGTGDLDPSTYSALKNQGDFESIETLKTDHQGSSGGVWSYAGRNIHYGVREHAMGAVSNGLALHNGIRPFASTFLIFSDYMRPAIRLASLMKLPVLYLFTHDSIGLGEDGPTHQPIEHLASLRAIPHLIVLRPADANETVEAWRFAIEWREGPIALILTRQNVPTIDRARYTSAQGVRYGAYILAESQSNPHIILIATGSEVQHALGAYEQLEHRGIASRVISMPSWELFERQSVSYRESVLPEAIKKRIVIEAAASLGWRKYAGEQGLIISIDRFGASAPGQTNMVRFWFTDDHVLFEALKLLEM
jgi:transketolase